MSDHIAHKQCFFMLAMFYQIQPQSLHRLKSHALTLASALMHPSLFLRTGSNYPGQVGGCRRPVLFRLREFH